MNFVLFKKIHLSNTLVLIRFKLMQGGSVDLFVVNSFGSAYQVTIQYILTSIKFSGHEMDGNSNTSAAPMENHTKYIKPIHFGYKYK